MIINNQKNSRLRVLDNYEYLNSQVNVSIIILNSQRFLYLSRTSEDSEVNTKRIQSVQVIRPVPIINACHISAGFVESGVANRLPRKRQIYDIVESATKVEDRIHTQ